MHVRLHLGGDEGDGAADRFAVDPRDFILRERLDDKESYLMDGAVLTFKLVLVLDLRRDLDLDLGRGSLRRRR